MVVPRNWENEDSIRHAVLLLRDGEPYNAQSFDSLNSNFEETFGERPMGTTLEGIRKGYVANGPDFRWPSLTDLGWWTRQRIYFPSPKPFGDFFWSGYYWRYIDTTGYSWNDNRYDENDISPYAQFLRNDVIVKQPFLTREWNVSPDTISRHALFGHEGRVILGHSDLRTANHMLVSTHRYPFDVSTSYGRQFSIGMDLNIDVNSICTDSNRGKSTSNLPLLRIQILYKKGYEDPVTDRGWTAEPFMPFKTAAHPTNAGWFLVMDEVIDKATYDALTPSWRTPDTVNGQSVVTRRGWSFKQYHKMLTNWHSHMTALNLPEDGSINDRWDGGARRTTPIPRGYLDPEKICSVDSVIQDPTVVSAGKMREPGTRGDDIFEIRILSTYRATVRIRSLTWQDTIVDKFLYRQRVDKDSTYALNPQGTAPSFYDDSVQKIIKEMYDLNKPTGAQREVMWNDVGEQFHNTGISMIAYIDHQLARVGWASHPRPQENGGFSLPFRRERMSYDGQPPSIMENQTQPFYSNDFGRSSWALYDPLKDLMPGDYMFYGQSLGTLSATTWPNSPKDTMMRTIIGRAGTAGANNLLAHSEYHRIYRGLSEYSHNLRGSTAVALKHPRNKRFAIQSAPSGLAVLVEYATKISQFNWNFAPDTTFYTHLITDLSGTRDTTEILLRDRFKAWYMDRPTNPEELYAQVNIALACGVSSFHNPQVVDFNVPGTGFPNTFGISKRTSGADPSYLDHDYNWGHRRTSWGVDGWTASNSNDVDGPLPNFYLGYSNNFRAWAKTFSKINQVYSTVNGSRYPFRRLEWLDIYSRREVANPNEPYSRADSISYTNAFLKVVKTSAVNNWQRNNWGSYIDLPTVDIDTLTMVDVGLFRDSGLKGMAAYLVNTRTWPTLHDKVDSLYYNNGFSPSTQSNERAASIFGDIDVRKVWMKIDTTKLDPSLRSTYYVVRDVHHQDSTWLVHPDSLFAVYIKPGDAKYLYFEKGISIKASPTANIGANDFCFNNGRRVAERYKGSRTVECYTRDGKLYVSYASRGNTIPYYFERSDGDNIATGHEQLVDSGNYLCARPSITVGRDDKSVMIVYWVRLDAGTGKGQLKVMYQSDTNKVWKSAMLTTKDLYDTTSDLHMVTPVVAPSLESPPNTPSFVVLSASNTLAHAPFGILGVRVGISAGNPSFGTHQMLFTDPADKECLFPTVASRPADTSVWPIRYAWERYNHIYYQQAKEFSGSLIVHPNFTPNPRRLSGGLPSCENHHPAIAMNGVYHPDYIALPGGSNGSSIEDYVVWEAKLRPKNFVNNPLWSQSRYWVVSTGSHLPLNSLKLPAGKLQWSGYNIFPIKIGDTLDMRWPVISAEKRIDYKGYPFRPSPTRGVHYHDWIRMGWTVNATGNMEFVHWKPNWAKTVFKESGAWPSLAQTTDSVQRWTDTSMVPRSMVFVGTASDVRITNGWFPLVSNVWPKNVQFVMFRKDTLNLLDCKAVIGTWSASPGGVVGPGNPPSIINWTPADMSRPVLTQDWPTVPDIPVALHTTVFDITPGSVISIPRTADTADLPLIRSGLQPGSSVTAKLILRRAIDSSEITTIDSLCINNTDARWPYYSMAIDPELVEFHVPMGWSADSVFVEAQFIKGDDNDDIDAFYAETDEEDSLVYMEKRGSKNVVLPQGNLAMSVAPNPFNSFTSITLNTGEGLQTKVQVFDAVGRLVATLFDGVNSEKEMHFEFDAHQLPSGTYLVRAQSGSEVITKQMQLVK